MKKSPRYVLQVRRGTYWYVEGRADDIRELRWLAHVHMNINRFETQVQDTLRNKVIDQGQLRSILTLGRALV